MTQNPYTHLRTLLDDESKHWEINAELRMIDPTQPVHGLDYTTSLNALLPLWPEGWGWMISENGEAHAWKKPPISDSAMEYFQSFKPTPALAMLDCLLQVKEYEWEGSVELSGADIDKCPQCGGPADNGHDRELPPNPYVCTKCMLASAKISRLLETGAIKFMSGATRNEQ
jgi:hypothetical protein